MVQATVRLLAEPKSGTSWLNSIVHTFLASCRNDACSDWQPTTVGNLEIEEAVSTRLQHATSFSTLHKHAWPPIDGAPECANASFLHPSPEMPKGFPCGLSRKEAADRTALERCARVCTRSDACSDTGSDAAPRYLQIFRDPRDVAVSLCFWVFPVLRKDGGVDEREMDKCLKWGFPMFSAWTKYRELWRLLPTVRRAVVARRAELAPLL